MYRVNGYTYESQYSYETDIISFQGPSTGSMRIYAGITAAGRMPEAG
jgi:hypothetical protein